MPELSCLLLPYTYMHQLQQLPLWLFIHMLDLSHLVNICRRHFGEGKTVVTLQAELLYGNVICNLTESSLARELFIPNIAKSKS